MRVYIVIEKEEEGDVMSNLGAYQTMTTIAKKFGGPVKLGLAIAVGGYAVIRTGESVCKLGIKKIRSHNRNKKCTIENAKIYSVTETGASNEGVVFHQGDTYKVLERDAESVLVELIGNDNNPYFVSVDFLSSISDYK